MGKIQASREPEYAETETLTPLEQKLQVLGKDVRKAGLVSGVIFFLILLLRFFIDQIQSTTSNHLNEYVLILRYLVVAAAVGIFSVSDTACVAVIICLGNAERKILRDSNLVRKRKFIEALGIVDNILCEKTVALTADIAECKAAGIKVRMLTTDNLTTATPLARECGIIDPDDSSSLVLEGPEFMERIGGVVCKLCRTGACGCPQRIRTETIANAIEFDRIYPRLDVLARCRPQDKYALVIGLSERGLISAVIGDGNNDASALKKANVGFATQIGTEVAKEAADIILLDNSLASIVRYVRWGRNIYENVRKLLQFQLTVNVVAIGITLVGAAILNEVVFTPLQFLWVNLLYFI